MDQLGTATISSTIVPFLMGTVFANIEEDNLLQKAVSFGGTLTEVDRGNIADNYSLKTTSIINSNLEFKKVFWDEFFTWLDAQKTLTTDPVILAKRLLPVKPDGGYYDEASRNFNKFGFQTIKAFEFFKINQKIEDKYGKDSPEATKEKDKLKNGDLILIRSKNGKFDYYENQDVRRALESVKKSAEFFGFLQSEETSRGLCATAFNPIQKREEGAPEVKSTVLDLNKQIWANKAAIMQKHLEITVGMHVDGPLKVNNGIASGQVVDKKGTKLKLEVSVIKPGKKVYKFTFIDRPTQNFSLNEDQLQDHFVNKKRSALEVHALVQADKEKQRAAMPVAAYTPKGKEKGKPREGVEAEERKKRTAPAKGQLETRKPIEPPRRSISGADVELVTNMAGGAGGLQSVSSTLEPPIKGPMLAKQEFEAGFHRDREVVENGRYLPRGNAEALAPDKNVGSKARSKKNPVFQVMKWYGIAGAGLGGVITGITLFT